MTDADPDPHEIAISAVNRRRRRRTRAQAKAPHVTRSWAEYGPVGFFLTGPGSLLGGLLYLGMGALSVFLPWIIIGAAYATREDRHNAVLPEWGFWALYALVAIALFVALVASVAMVTALWRIVRKNFGRL